MVLLASHLINTDDGTRHAFLETCRRHVADDRCVIIQQFSPGWFAAVSDSETGSGPRWPGAALRLDRYLTEDRSWLRAIPVRRPG